MPFIYIYKILENKFQYQFYKQKYCKTDFFSENNLLFLKLEGIQKKIL